MLWTSLVPPSYPLNASLGALYGPLILHFHRLWLTMHS